MDFSKLFKTLCVGLFTSAGLLASSEEAEPRKPNWPPCLRTIVMNGHTFTKEELEHNARTGHPLRRATHHPGAKAMQLSIEGPCITAKSFDPESDPTWFPRMKALHAQKHKDVWYEMNKPSQPIMMCNATDEGIMAGISFPSLRGPDACEGVIVAGYMTQSLASTLGQKMVVFGADKVMIIFRSPPPPLSWITPNFQDMHLNSTNILIALRSRYFGEAEKDALTYTHKQKGAYLVTIQGHDIRIEPQVEDFCRKWRARILEEIIAHNHGTPPSQTPGVFFDKSGFFYGSAHFSDYNTPLLSIKFGIYEPTLALKNLCFSRKGEDEVSLMKPIWISGYMDFDTLTTRGLLVEGLPTVSFTIGRAVSLADTLD